MSLEVLQKVVKDRYEKKDRASVWPDSFVNSKTGKEYKPHNEDEKKFVYGDTWRYGLLKGGEGGGKSTAGIIKTLNKIRTGQSGIMGSSDLEHFKKSLWPEFRNWCPWHLVAARQQYRKEETWEPSQAFTLVFKSEAGIYARLICGGFKESEIVSWEGPNVSFAHFDEARRHNTPAALKVLDGRARIKGPIGETPQVYITTTPKKHWLFDYFGPLRENDPLKSFKENSFTGTIPVYLNEENLSEDFIKQRRSSLTESEARILMDAEWEDESDTDKFVNIIWFDACKKELPPLTENEPIVIALDAAEGSESSVSDCFAMVVCSRSPNNIQNVAVRYCRVWQAKTGHFINFEPIEQELRRLCEKFSVIEVAYDPYQLHDMCSRLHIQGVAFFRRFGQQKERLEADKQLQDLITSRRLEHDGNNILRSHIDNSNVKKIGTKVRLIKRNQSEKIDAAVATSMAAYRILYYNLG